MDEPALPSFDLVVATVDRAESLEALLASIARQGDVRARVIVVDQNDDDRAARVIERHPALDVLHLRSGRGLSRARNAGLERVEADVVAFPDDDCTYPDGLLGTVAARLRDDGLDGLTGRAADDDGRSDPSWSREPATLDATNLWNRAISFSIFLRRPLVERVGGFDERLGLGSGTPWSSGEEIDYLVRAIRLGARITYDPDLVVRHRVKRYAPDELRAVGRRDGESIGWILRRHRYGARETGRLLVRPLGGIGLSLARLDLTQARFHAATFGGRLHGYLRSDPS